MKTIFSSLAIGLLLSFFTLGQQLNNQPVISGFSNQVIQSSSSPTWSDIKEANIPTSGTRYITPTEYRTVELNATPLLSALDQAPMEFTPQATTKVVTIDLPLPDGTVEQFRIVESPIMEQPLQDQFSDIRTFYGTGITDPAKTVRFDFTPKGFHAMIMVVGESTIFIDPYSYGGGDVKHYIVYARKDFASSVTKDFECAVTSTGTTPTTSQTGKLSFNTCELRVYRLALAATGEYTTFHGGTVAGALAAQVTTMNRVNGIYERDLAVRMDIIANNNLIIYTNAGSDPYTNNNGGTMLNENINNLNAVIGNANFDIGHVFSTGGGGIAGLGVVCTTSKARGVTGNGAPIGDPFDVDYVAHEMGHQFGANHTQNNACNRNNATAMEPGSASTIMGYAGICAPNVQSNSDDHFHGVNLLEIGNQLNSHSCPVTTALANSSPTITGTNGNATVPANTPFSLTAIATDPDGDVLSYNWEQMNNQVSTQPPVSTATGGPNFRSYSSSTDPTRYFPNLTDLSAGNPTTWEVLSSVTRTMDFRITVRDNSAGGSCTDYIDVTVDVDGGSGPFIVQYPSATGIVWNALTTETVTWDVANTDIAPVSCSNVDILLSTDGGLTYPTVLASNVPNDGSQAINVPNTSTTTARVMVVCSSGTFFDISNNNFEIAAATFDYTLSTAVNAVSVCTPNDAVYTIDIGEIGGYSDPVNLSVSGLPAGATSSFSTNPVTPIGQSTLTISNIGAVAPGSYTFSVDATSTTGPQTLSLDLNVSNGTPNPIALTSPTNGANGVSTNTSLTWAASPEFGATYEIDIATDAGFGTIIDQATGLSTNSYTSGVLSTATFYYWRVRVVTGCGTSAYSSTFSFETSTCTIYTSTNIPVTIPSSGTPTVTSTVTVGGSGTVQDVNVTQLTGTHTWINDLTVTLTSPTGTVVTLFDQICGNVDNFDVQFDDAATPGALPCPPTGGGLYQPSGSLATFNGEAPAGTWTLTITDNANQDGGTLTAWAIEVCTAGLATATGTDTQTACDSYTWIDGNTYTTSNNTATFLIVGGAVGGADSLVTLDLTMNYSTAATDVQTACGSYTWLDGNTYTSSNNTATFTTTNAAGCDSVITLDLTVNSATTATDLQTACGPYTWLDGNTYTSSNNTATFTTTNAAGCDSVITLDLTISAPTTATDVQTACGPYTWIDGNTYTSSNNTATFTTTNSAGCDSVITLNLSVGSPTTGTDVQTACVSYTWIDGNTYTSSNNTATFTTTNVAGCDSVITLNLTIASSVSGTDTQVTCGPFTWIDGNTYTSSNNTATFTLIGGSVNGCDSIVSLDLTVGASTTATDIQTACDSYTWIDGNTYTTSNNSATFTTTNSAGCDSVITLDLTITTVDNGVTQLNYNTMEANSATGTYQWIDCATNTSISGATSQGYTATVNGNYAVIVTNGICSDTSSCVLINTIGVDEISTSAFMVYPNPTEGQLTVTITDGDANDFKLFDAIGRVVMSGTLENGVNQISIAHLATGTYTCELTGFSGAQPVIKL